MATTSDCGKLTLMVRREGADWGALETASYDNASKLTRAKVEAALKDRAAGWQSNYAPYRNAAFKVIEGEPVSRSKVAQPPKRAPRLEPHCGSWVIVNRATGKAVSETFSRDVADFWSSHDGLEVLTAAEWLCRFNAAAKGAA